MKEIIINTKEEYYYETYTVTSNFEEEAIRKKNIISAFLTGFKAGKDIAETDLATIAYMQGAERYKTKWHRISDGDLPKHTRYVWTNVGPSYYDDDRDCP